MGVYLEDMDLPEKCCDCRFNIVVGVHNHCAACSDFITILDYNERNSHKPDCCPLREVNDRPTTPGKWIETLIPQLLFCSVCDCWSHAYDYEPMKFCPNCGAKMDLEG